MSEIKCVVSFVTVFVHNVDLAVSIVWMKKQNTELLCSETNLCESNMHARTHACIHA